MISKHPLVAVHGFGTYAILYAQMIAMAKRESREADWAMILPTSHHLDIVRRILDPALILCLEQRQAWNPPTGDLLDELSGYPSNIYADIEAEKRPFKHRPGVEQTLRALETYRIYKEFLVRSGATHVLLSNIETLDGKLLVGLAQELGLICSVPTDCRNLGGIYFSPDAGEGLPRYRAVSEDLMREARRFVSEFRRRPKPALNPPTVDSDDEELDEPLLGYRKSMPRRIFGSVLRAARRPRLFEPALAAISFRNNFPVLRDGVRGVRAARNSRRFDIAKLEHLPEKFIYYPLQVTPESSINSPAPFFVDQFRAIDLIRFAMPSDCSLVVKEHPAFVGIRPARFYRLLRRKAGVRLAHVGLPSIELMKRAALTVSVTGTATFEAFLLGCPSLALGSSLVAEYLGGFGRGDDLTGRIRAALAARPDEARVIEAVAELLSVRYNVSFRPPDEPGSKAARRSNIRRLLDAVLDHMRRLETVSQDVCNA